METLNLSRLLNLINELPAYDGLVAELRQAKTAKADAIEAARPYLIAALNQTLKRPIVVITAHAEESRRLYDQVSIWLGSADIKLMPEADTLPYERIVSDMPTALERLHVLSALVNAQKDKKPPLAVIPATALIQKTASFGTFAAAFHIIKEEAVSDPLVLMKRWQSLGYTVESTVEIPGTMSRRGGIIDIFPPASDMPARLEFFGNTVESIRLYDRANQRSVRRIVSITNGTGDGITGAFSETVPRPEDILKTLDFTNCSEETRQSFSHELSELYRGQKTVSKEFYAPLFNQDSLLSYLPENTLLIIDEPLSVQRTIEDFGNKAQELNKTGKNRANCRPISPSPTSIGMKSHPPWRKYHDLVISTFGTADKESTHQLNFKALTGYGGQLPNFIAKIKQMLAGRERLILVTHQANRLSELLGEADIIAPVLTEIKQTPQPGSLTLLQGLLNSGWSLQRYLSVYRYGNLRFYQAAASPEKEISGPP